MISSPEYFGALLSLRLEGGAAIEQIEEPFLCEDGKTYELRAWLRDGRSVSRTYEIAPAGADVPAPGGPKPQWPSPYGTIDQ